MLKALSVMTRRRELWLVTLLTLIAFALRLIDLDARSLWLDESFTLLRANGTWAEMIANTVWRQGLFTTDLNPPLYFALLKAWSELAGLSTFALRLFSAFWAVLIVPLTYALGRRLFGSRRTAIVAAALAVLGPTYQWYAAELRMYSLMACLGAASVYFFYRMLHAAAGRGAFAAVWLATSALALFTHFSFISLGLAQIAFLLVAGLWPLRDRRMPRASRNVLIGAGLALVVSLAAFALLGAPTVARASQLANDALTNPNGLGVAPLDFMQETISALAFGLNAGDPTGTGGVLTVLMGLLIVLGVVLPLSRRWLSVRVMLALTIIVPMAFWLILSYLIASRPSFRYVIFIFPVLHVLIAHATGVLFDQVHMARPAARWASAIGATLALIVALGASTFGVSQAFVRSRSWQDDWRGFASYIRQNWQPGDVLLINFNTPEAVLPVYLRDLPIPTFFTRDWLMRPSGDVRREINDNYGRVWYANTGGDGGLHNREAQTLLAPYLLRARTPFPARTTIIELLEYDAHPLVVESLPATATPVADAPPAPPAPTSASIAGYEIEPGNPYNRNTNFRLALYWRRGLDDPASQSVSVRLKSLTNGEQVWLDWTFPAQLAAHPAEWVEGTLYRMSTVVPVPPGLPVQPYQLDVQVRGDKGEVVQTISQSLDASELDCCVRIARLSGDDRAVRWQTGDVTLESAEYPDVRKPGQPLPIALTWQPNRADLTTWQTELKLDGLLGGEVTSTVRDAGAPDFPVNAWPAGELARDQYALQIPFTAQPGWYRLSLNRWRDGKILDGTLLGLMRVEDYPRTPVATQVQRPVNARVGEMSLLGYSVNEPVVRGKTYDFVTHWRVEQTPARDGVLSLQMFSPDGKPISQDDNPPLVNGAPRSTLTYRAGDGIDQIHRLTIPGDLPAGEYPLYALIYDRVGGLRWPAQQEGQPAKDDLVRVGSITLP